MTQSTPRRRRNRFRPFSEVQADLAEGTTLEDFQCLARTARPQYCDSLQRSQIDEAGRLVSDNRILDEHKLWDIITLLTCAEHQRQYSSYWRNQIDEQWRGEIPDLQITGGPRRSPFSPSRSSRRNQVSVPISPSPRSTAERALAARTVPTNEQIPPGDTSSAEDADVPVVEPTASEMPDAFPTSSDEDADTDDTPEDTDEDEQEVPVAPQNTLGSAFSPGELANSPRWCVRGDVRRLLLEPLPSARDKGTIYAFEDGTRNMVKIGFTTRDYKKRRREVEGQTGITITRHWCLPGIPYIQLLRLEKLVHTDLAHYQHDLKIPHGTGYRTHREWFAVDMPIAQRTIKTWWSIMQHSNMRPGKELSNRINGRLHTDPMFDVVDLHDDSTYYSHDETLELWKRLFQLPQESKRRKVPTSILYLGGVALFIYSMKAGLSLRDSISVTAVLMTIALVWFK